MIIKINGATLNQPPSLSIHQVIEQTSELIQSKNRKVRRSKPMKAVVASFITLSGIATATVAKAETINPLTPSDYGGILTKLIGDTVKHKILFQTDKLEGVLRENTLMWQMNEFMKTVLLQTQDFFDNPQIVGIFHSIGTICMSFTTILIAKKGFDLVKAKILGTNSIGMTELIVRLLASVVMTFLSLDIIQLGIEGSNLVVGTLFKAIESHLIPYEVLERSNVLGLTLWLVGYSLMFLILGIQYWVRQITLVILGCLAPVANTSWIVDGGKMLSTLAREIITMLTTPIAHGLVLGIGSVIMFELTTLTGNVFIDAMNSVFIGFSTMFLMVFTPKFIRMFVSGDGNPYSWALKVGKQLVGLPGQFTRFIR